MTDHQISVEHHHQGDDPVDDDEVRLVIDQIVLHPQFGVTTQYDSDIAVLKLRTPQTTFCAKEKV